MRLACGEGVGERDLARDRPLAVLVWGMPVGLLAAGMVWAGARGPLWTVGFSWVGAACTANALRCGRVHCAILGPAFLLLGLASLAEATGLIAIGWTWLGNAATGVVVVAYVPELLGKKYFGTAGCEESSGRGAANVGGE